MGIKIIMTALDLPQELVDKHDIGIVSLHVTFWDDSTFTERVTITPGSSGGAWWHKGTPQNLGLPRGFMEA